jgi:hypothetical protein
MVCQISRAGTGIAVSMLARSLASASSRTAPRKMSNWRFGVLARKCSPWASHSRLVRWRAATGSRWASCSRPAYPVTPAEALTGMGWARVW